MRILFIQTSAGTGGSKSSLLAALPVLRESGCTVRVLCGEEGSFTERCREMGVPFTIVRLPEWRKWAERLFFSFKVDRALELIRDEGFDVVIANEMWWAPHARRLASRLGAKSAAVVRDLIAVGPKAKQYRLDRIDRVLCVSDAIRGGLAGQGVPGDRLTVLYNPISVPGKDLNGVPEWRTRCPGVQRWLGYIGKIGDRKNQVQAVRVLAHLRELSGVPWGLVLAGDAESGYLEGLRAEVTNLGLQDAVVEAGHVTPVGNVLGFIDAVILTSRREGLPRSLIEALLAGVPAFSFTLDGLDEIYEEHFSMFVPGADTDLSLARIIYQGFENENLDAATRSLSARLRLRHNPATYPERLRSALALS